jgi:hypothetical protein
MNTWIFQADPRHFRLDDFLATSPEVCVWRASAQQSKMRIGDTVYLWRSIGAGDRGRAGVVAKGEISAPVAELRDDTPSKEFWLNRFDADSIFDRVAIRITCIGRRIAYDDLKSDPILSGMKIVKAGIGTNFLLKPDHAKRLEAIWSKSGDAWDRAELLEALLAYENGTKQEVLSTRVGRAISEVRRKLASFQNIDPRSPFASPSPVHSVEIELWNEFYDRHAKQLRIGEMDTAIRCANRRGA